MRGKKLVWSIAHTLIALVVMGGLLVVGGLGVGPVPALGPLLNPGTGAWTIAADARTPVNQTLSIQGFEQPVQVQFETDGIAHIRAATDHDLFMAIGYLHAVNRLGQMDLMRRQGAGLLAQIVGPSALPSDEFERKLGLARAAQMEWDRMAPDDPAREALLAYTRGVNAYINEAVETHHLPLLFKLLNYTPALWTPLDSLIIEKVLTQTLSFSTGPLEYALLTQKLGYERTMQWFPIVPSNEQHPSVTGPYQKSALEPATPSDLSAFQAASDLLAQIQALPTTSVRFMSNSNAWALSGAKTASGKPLLAADPHLEQTLPPIWYQFAATSPSYQFAGVSIPGLPIILLGRNQYISWGLTNTQNQSTLYYQEKMDAAHPQQYFWNGAWRPVEQTTEDIPIKGGRSEVLTIERTVHGPIMTQKGQTLSVWWTGAQPSADLQAMLSVVQAQNFAQFRNALRSWISPTQNFVYADSQGNIGLIAAGYYPQVKSGRPWLPLPGTGEADVSGAIPFDALPQVYNPPQHFVFSANQRPVSADYPYYIGTSLDYFDPGDRANTIYYALQRGEHFTVDDMEKLQNDTHNYLAQSLLPPLLQALRNLPSPNGQEREALSLLSTWDGNMAVDSSAATIWTWFWSEYVYETFHAWWDYYHVPQSVDDKLAVTPEGGSRAMIVLGESVQDWTLHDPNNPAFSLPNGTKRTAQDVMQQAFKDIVKVLTDTLGSNTRNWTWGSVNQRLFTSLLQFPSLSYGPRPSSGSPQTVNAAEGGQFATAGPSWRFIMDWQNGQSMAVYPGGQSENPLSPWYTNQVETWWVGKYYVMYADAQLQTQSGVHTWILRP